MHRSKLAAALVDVPADVYDREVGFWSAVVGREPETGEENPEYSFLGEPVPGLQFMLQKVDAPARVHLDVETDDVEAEVSRLEALGAERVAQVKSWWIMRDPAGLLFCVVRIQTGESFETLATEWP
ncbi:MAG TPA: VOC family protein [Acidimicrobiales bacterium]|nr:VOC family protein [Acidimicrobiales bacterium]